MGIFSKKDEDTTVDAPVQAHEAEELDSVEAQNKLNNELIAGDGPTEGLSVEEPHRKEDETQQEYNERVPVAVQPVLEGPTLSYLGKPL